VAPRFGAIFGVVLFVWTTLEAISRRSLSLWLSMGFFGTLAIVGAAIFGNEILRAGDDLLRQQLAPVVNNFAAGGWMFGGALFGAFCGSLRRWGDLFSVRILALTFGWIATLGLVYATLAGVSAR
jgi:hypothetical protein